MEPTIKNNSIISVRTDDNNYSKDDIITFTVDIDNDGYTDFVTHRIYKIEDEKFYTYSDNGNKLDSWIIDKSDIIGKVYFTIPYVGMLIPTLVKYTLPITISMLVLIITLLVFTFKNWKKL